MTRLTAKDFPQQLLEYYDYYAHGKISKREFLQLAGKYTVGGMTALALFNLLSLHSLWGWLFVLATPLLVKQARYVLRESDPLAMRPMLEKTVKGALLTNLLFVIGIIASKLAA